MIVTGIQYHNNDDVDDDDDKAGMAYSMEII